MACVFLFTLFMVRENVHLYLFQDNIILQGDHHNTEATQHLDNVTVQYSQLNETIRQRLIRTILTPLTIASGKRNWENTSHSVRLGKYQKPHRLIVF